MFALKTTTDAFDNGDYKNNCAQNDWDIDSWTGGPRRGARFAGRRAAHATFGNPMNQDRSTQVILGMDLSPLVVDENADIAEYVLRQVDKFRDDVRAKLVARLRMT